MLIPIHAPGVGRLRLRGHASPKTFAPPAQNGQETVDASLRS